MFHEVFSPLGILMIVIHSYALAIILCCITMLCWGSWANTQKLTGKDWPFQLFYWDWSIGVVVLSLILAFTMGSMGTEGRPFLDDLRQADIRHLTHAFVGGVILNAGNILLIMAMSVAGMAVAFPVGIGLALIIGVITTYHVDPTGNLVVLVLGAISIVIAISLDALAYKRVSSQRSGNTLKGISLAILCGIISGFFYRYIAVSMPLELANIHMPNEVGKLTPYTALVVFSLGIFLSGFIFNSIAMKLPVVGERVSYRDYFNKGNPRLHLIGISGGVIWCLGMAFSVLAGDVAGYAISYGLGQCATLVAALWGILVWKEFKSAPKGTNKLLVAMLLFFTLGIFLIIMSRYA